MPDKETIRKARRDAAQGKSPSTQAGEFVRAEIDKIRGGEHGARNTKQAIAIGLSEARRAGFGGKPGRNASPATRRKAQQDLRSAGGRHRTSRKRSEATLTALRREPRSTASRAALSKQARSAARTRSAGSRKAAARKGARTRHRGR